VCHWAWTPEGWLTVLGYKDFCGSGVVHLVGGSCAIVAAILLEPRYGRWRTSESDPHIDFEAHNTPVIITYCLLFHWIAFPYLSKRDKYGANFSKF